MSDQGGEVESGESRAGACAKSEAPTEAQLSENLGRSLALALRSRPGLVESLVDVIAKGLQAEKWSYDLVLKERVYEPDFKERREMAKFAAAYLEGLPTQMVVNLSAGGAGQPRLADVLRASPNGRRAVEAFLARMESSAPSGSPASAPVIEA